MKKLTFLTLAFLLLSAHPVPAHEHENSNVNFLEYSKTSFELAKKENKPMFILISAVWCPFCKNFNEKSLKVKKVYEYLNENFINIFVDYDLQTDVFTEHGGTQVPYVIFKSPDGEVITKYGGALYGDDFLGILKEVKARADN